MSSYLWVGLGGALGAMARYALGTWLIGRAGSTFPLHTLLINVTGSLAIGVLLTLLTERLQIGQVGQATQLDHVWRLFLVVGFLGGYTTFSSFSYETLTLMRQGFWAQAAWYVVGSNALGLAACAAGMAATRALSK